VDRKAFFRELGKKKVAFITIQIVPGIKSKEEDRICPAGTWWPKDSGSSLF